MCSLPQETGLYWAKRDLDSDWLYVALIRGVKPFLTYTLWDTEYPDNEHSGYDRTNLKNLMFSDRIQIKSEKPNKYITGFNTTSSAVFNVKKDLVPIKKPGLYIIKTQKDKLAYIKGEAPYFTCWIWEIANNQKYKHLTPENLLFVEYIEKPE